MELKDIIFYLRKKHGMSQEMFAEKMSVSRQSVSKWETGDATPDINKIIKMGKLFNMTVSEILEYDLLKYLTTEIDGSKMYESVYAINEKIAWKGKKPLAVIVKNVRIITPTWKCAIETILKQILKEEVMRKRIFNLRDKLLGTKRKKLATEIDGMHSPVKLDEGLYIETNYGANILMNLLLEILNEISYDCNKVKIVLKN